MPRATKARFFHRAAWGLCFLTLMALAPANAGYNPVAYATKIHNSSPQQIGVDDFGQRVDLYNGSTIFQATDIQVPGNASLDVAVGRRMTPGRLDGTWPSNRTEGLFGDWDIDIPHMVSTHDHKHPWHVNDSNRTKRCSSNAVAPPWSADGNFEGHEFWSGIRLHVPGKHSGLVMLAETPLSARPQQSAAYRWVTVDGWYLSCLPSLSFGAGEGFLALSPDGSKYYFNWMVQQDWSHMRRLSYSGGVALGVDKIFLYPTRVEDRHGNWVTYTWSQKKLMRIDSNDGRRISFTYEGTEVRPRIASVSVADRTWRYYYRRQDAENDSYLERVVLPDLTQWVYQSPQVSVFFDFVYGNPNGCAPRFGLSHSSWKFTYGVTHPSMAKAEFDFHVWRHQRTRVTPQCSWDHWERDANKSVGNYYYVSSLEKVRVTGAGLPPYEMQITYPNVHLLPDNCPACPTTKDVITSETGGRVVRYRYSTRYGVDEGRLQSVEVGSSLDTLVPSVFYYYDSVIDSPAPPYQRKVGSGKYFSGFDPLAEQRLPVRAIVNSREGMSFIYRVLEFDAFARPTRVEKRSAASGYVPPSGTRIVD